MINLLYEKFPDCIQADGLTYPVRTDFRIWLKFSDILSDKKMLTEQELAAALMSVFTKPVLRFSGSLIDSIFGFYHADLLDYPRESDEDDEKNAPGGAKPPVFDWKIDARYLLGDFRHFYHIDLISADYLHWFEFRALFDALPDDSHCMKRIAYRSADLSQIKNDAEKKRIRKIKRAIALPSQNFTRLLLSILCHRTAHVLFRFLSSD